MKADTVIMTSNTGRNPMTMLSNIHEFAIYLNMRIPMTIT